MIYRKIYETNNHLVLGSHLEKKYCVVNKTTQQKLFIELTPDNEEFLDKLEEAMAKLA